MNSKLNYLLKYISMSSYEKLLEEKNNYYLEELVDNRRNIQLNTEYLIKYGVTITDKMYLNYLSELEEDTDNFINKIKKYEEHLTKEEVISLIENN